MDLFRRQHRQIADDLTLNLLMRVWPVEAVRVRQAGYGPIQLR